MKNRSRTLKIGVSLLALLALLASALTLNARGRSIGDLLASAARSTGADSAVVASVDGEPIRLQELVQTKIILQNSADGAALTAAEAYQQAMKILLRNRVLIQEARRRGLTVSEAEAEAYLAQIKQQATESPELTQVLADFIAAAGGDPVTYEKKAVAAYREGLLMQKLDQALAQEIPPPTETEISDYLARRPGSHLLILIPISFMNVDTAQRIYAELQSLAATQGPDVFSTTFAGYAVRLNRYAPGDVPHQTFQYATLTELPDYAQAAAGSSQGQMGLFTRPDGTAVVYLVLHAQQMTQEELRANARTLLMEQRQRDYISKVEQELLSKARVKFYPKNLPQNVRSALAPILEPEK